MHSSCQTRALNLYVSGQGTRPFDILVSGPANERGFKAEFDYDERKGIGASDRGPSLLEREAIPLDKGTVPLSFLIFAAQIHKIPHLTYA